MTVLVQPEGSSGKSAGELDLGEIFRDSMNLLGLIHKGMLSNARFNPCGGLLTFMRMAEAKNVDSRLAGGEIYVQCSGPCKRNFATNFTREQLQSILFSLMLKQMVPQLHTCDLIDFGLSAGYKMRQLGLISVTDDVFLGLEGHIGVESYKYLILDHYGLGFMLIPGMSAKAAYGELGPWLQLLAAEQHHRFGRMLDELKTLSLGPRSRGP